MSKQREAMRQILADRCDGNGETPYLISQNDVVVKPMFGLRAIPLSKVESDSFIHISGQCQDMCDITSGKPGNPEKFSSWIQVTDVYHEDGISVIETKDGRMFSTEAFTKEWAQKLEMYKDLEFSNLVRAAAQERGELMRTNTMALLKAMDVDLEKYQIPKMPVWNMKMRAITNSIVDYLQEHELNSHLYKGKCLPKEHIEGIKNKITHELNAPIRRQQLDFNKQLLLQCYHSDKPIIYAQDLIAVRQDGMPININNVGQGYLNLITQERDMADITATPQEVRREDVAIRGIEKTDKGTIIMTDQGIISTYDFSNQWVQFLRRNDPEKLIGLAGVVRESILDGIRIPSEEMPTVSEEIRDKQRNHQRISSRDYEQLWEYNQALEERKECYAEILRRTIESQKTPVQLTEDTPIFAVEKDGRHRKIERDEIEPGMVISFTGKTNLPTPFAAYDWANFKDDTQMFVDDCIMIDGQAVIVTPDCVLIDRNIDSATLDMLQRNTGIQAKIEQNAPTHDELIIDASDLEIDFGGNR